MQAAHLVPSGDYSQSKYPADVIRAIAFSQKQFDKYLGSDKRDTLINGFWAEPGHAGTHKKKYFRDLAGMLRKASDGPSAKRALSNMWRRVKRGRYL
jgi:hypothetical protein